MDSNLSKERFCFSGINAQSTPNSPLGCSCPSHKCHGIQPTNLQKCSGKHSCGSPKRLSGTSSFALSKLSTHNSCQFNGHSHVCLCCLHSDLPRQDCGTLWRRFVQGHIFYGFPGVNKPANKCGPLPRDDFNRSCILPYGYCRNMALPQDAGHGMAERDAAGCPSKSVACSSAWVLNSVSNLYTVCRHLRAALIKPKSLQTSVSKHARAESFLVCLLVF